MTDDFSEDGVLAKIIKGFKVREPQKIMAKVIAKAIEREHQLIIEAGTGTGKTFAYLVPALGSNKKVIISTGSKNLQDQLFSKDLPLVQKALDYNGKIALLKGRGNYLCLERLTNKCATASHLPLKQQHDLTKIEQWSSKTYDGDISKCTNVTEDNIIWRSVTSTNDNCLGGNCLHYENCYVVKARRGAMNADITVINHHLFLADIVVKDHGFGELIPNVGVMVFDEAHQIPDLASQYFGVQLSTIQLIDLSREISKKYRNQIKNMPQLQKCADKLEKSTRDFGLVISKMSRKGNLRDLLKNEQIKRQIMRVLDALNFCQEVLKLGCGLNRNLDNSLERIGVYQGLLERLINSDETGFSYIYECMPKSVVCSIIPLSISDRFQSFIKERGGSWIFTSATLSIDQNVDYFAKRLGLLAAKSLVLTSPFNFQEQALLCVPRYIPLPNEESCANKLATILLPVIESNGGRCFCLCTSYAMMDKLAEEFKNRTNLPVLVQGEISKTKLLAEFIEKGNALLVATNSFWEGVDVRGDALSCVIIDKLPFNSPEEPLIKARMNDCAKRGGDPFTEVQIPEAVITLKQGVGRLIRDHGDRGVIIICDNRLVTRPYGAIFLNSLPPLLRTRDINQVMQFLKIKKQAL